MKKLLAKIRKILHDRRTRRFLTRFVSGIAAIVVFITTYALVLPAITMEKEANCGIEAHQHDDSCYTEELICDIPESEGHHHDEGCYSTKLNLICETAEHEHSEENGCYDEEGNLICELKEHRHGDECYEEVRELTCEIPESDGHQHTEECYEKVLTCGKEIHVHSTACYEEEPASDTAVAASTSSATAATTSAGSVSSTGLTLLFEDKTEPTDDNETSVGNADTTDNGVVIDNDDVTDNGGTSARDGSTETASSGETKAETASAAEVTYGSENAGTGSTETANTALTGADNSSTASTSAKAADQYIPPLDAIDFSKVLNSHTGIYYYPVADGETVEDSYAIPAENWKRIPNNIEHKEDMDDVELGSNDLLRVYLSYTIPAGSLNTTNPVARYRLPSNLHLTDPQVKAINENANGIANQYIDMSTLEIKDPEKYDASLGLEAVEGTRRPDESVEDYLADQAKKTGADADDASEYISAIVRVENVYDTEGLYGEKDAYLGQDLIFTFTPYSIEKNQHEYDPSGQPTKAGEKIKGWLTLDLNMGQVDFGEPEITTSTVEQSEIDNIDDKAESDNINNDHNENEYSVGDNAAVNENSVEGESEEKTETNQNDVVKIVREERTTEIIFVAEGWDEKGDKIDQISTAFKAVEETMVEARDDIEKDVDESSTESTEESATEDATKVTAEAGKESSDNGKTEILAEEDSVNKTDDKAESNNKAADPVIMPAMSFNDSIKVSTGKPAGIDENAGGTLANAAESLPKKAEVFVRVEADEGTFPVGTTMVLKTVDDLDAVAKIVTDTLESGDSSVSNDGENRQSEQKKESKNKDNTDEKKNLKTYGFQAVDITFVDADGNEIEPAKPVRVALSSKTVEQVKEEAKDSALADPVVVHVDDEGNAEQMELVSPEEVQPAVGRSEAELLEENMAADNETVDTPDKSNEEETNQSNTGDTADAVNDYNDNTNDTNEAAAGSETNSAAVEETVDDEEQTNIVDDADTASTIGFTADSFSVYAIVYTVDFHWEVDGKTYEFKIPGGGFISFEQLVEVLGITGDTNSSENETNDIEKSASETDENNSEGALLTLDDVVVSEETRKFVADVESVDFSKPELVWVRKVDADSTVGKLKEINGLECQYSAELTEEQIAEINAQTVKTGDWAMISMLPFDTEESLTVTMKNGEQFVVKVTDSQDPLGLDGRTFSIVNNRNNNWYALRGERNTTTQNTRGYYLFADSVSHTIANNTEYCGIGADAWLFEYNADEKAYYVSCNGMYLYIDPTITSKTQSDPNNQYAHALDLKAEKDQSDKGTLLKISRDADGNYIFKSNSENITLWDYNNNTYWLSNESQETNSGEVLNSHMRLCLPEDSSSNASHKATLISAADTQPGQKIIIYQRVLDPTTDTFTYYAINGTGGMEKVYNSSDSVYWKGDLNIEWTLKDLGNGYYTLYNEKEQTYLTPKASTGTNGSYVVHKASDFDDSKHLSISLPGRDDGTYTSLISCWDYVDNATYGLKASETTQGGQVAIEPLLTSQSFYFAARDPIVHDQLTTVDTVDSVSKGIKITMYDWGNELGLDSHRQKWDAADWNNEIIQDRLPMMQDIMGESDSYADKYESGKVKPGILANYIDENQTAPNILKEDGTGNGHNLSELFSDDWIRTGTTAEKVNHLFLQSVYDETGFFKYSCFENYAYLPNGNDFTVYEQIGTPSNRTVNDYQKSNIIFERGNFMPYNPINAAMNYRQNNYDPDLKELPDGDPRKGERLYYIENAFPSGSQRYGDKTFYGNSNPEAYANYYIGMKMEAKFSQNPGGYADNGDPMIFEFNGDDDLWIYLDNVLVLDMGGVHDAFRGKINFRTGEVTCNALNGESTTIKAMFKKAGHFPDGTDWDDDRVNEYFRGNTFKDFTTHNFKMFYMERGASASDLELMFNLPVLAESQFRIKKELPGTNDGEVVQSQYGDAPFYYKAYVYDAEAGSMVTCTRQYLSSKGLDTPKYEDGSEVEWLTTNSDEEIFLIKPGQTALFPAIDDSVRWYTEEVAPPQNENMLKKFSVSNSDQDNDINYEVGVKSKERTILVRNMVIYQNRPDTELVNELQIKKKINGNAYNADDSFEYRIYLEKTDGKLGVYRLGEYYQFDKDNNFVFYENGVRHTAKMEVLTNGHYRYYDFDDDRPEETVEVQKITEHTSTNGSVGDVRDGDTIIIKGLLVGTDFYVYERTDYSYMSPDSTPVEGKYVFEGTDVTDAYTRNPETNKPENELIFNSLYGPPDSEAINSYPHSAYEREKAASGAIIEHKDAKILVKNKPYLEIPEGTISVEKKWLDEDNHDITSTVTDKSVTYDIYRLVHVHEMECIVDQEPTDTEPGVQHFECKHDGCNYELPPEQIEPKGHQWSEWEEKHRKTCTEQGIWERHCLNPGCNATETWTEEPLGHDWDDGVITQPATTTQTGIRHHVCQNDSSHTWDEEIPKLAGNITYHIRNMYNHGQALQIDSYPGDGTIAAGTGNAIRVSYTLKSNNPDEQWAYGNSNTQPENIPKTQKYIDYNYYYDYSVTIPIEEGKELYLYLGDGHNSSRSNFKIEVIEYYDVNTMNARPMLFSKSSAARARGPQKNSASDGPTNNAELNAKLAQIGYSETDEQTHAVVNHNFYQWDKYDSASQSWKTDGVSTETLQNGRWSKTYTVPLTDENGNPYEYYFIEKSITPEGEVAHWTTTYTNQDGGLTASGTVTINNKKVPEKGSLLITKNVTYNGGTPVPAGKQSYVNKDYKFTITKDGSPIAQSPVTISVTNGSSNEILIDNLDPGDYEIIETDSAGLRLTSFSGGKAQDTGNKSITVTVTAGKMTKEQLEEAAKATFVNDYSETSVTLKKIDKANLNADNPALLKGASFTITKYKTAVFREIDKGWGENGSKTLSDVKDKETDTYPLNGSFTFSDLPAGYYMIEEIAFPDGYIKLNNNPRIEIGEDMKVYLLDSDGQRISGNATEIIRVMPVTETQPNNIIRIGNEPGAALPNTGGPGTRLFTILGSILILGAGVLLWRRRRLI